jgi:hypothetical protein
MKPAMERTLSVISSWVSEPSQIMSAYDEECHPETASGYYQKSPPFPLFTRSQNTLSLYVERRIFQYLTDDAT